MQLCLYDDLECGTGVGWAARYKREGTDAYIELTHFTVQIQGKWEVFTCLKQVKVGRIDTHAQN